jgi:hypothetical protein
LDFPFSLEEFLPLENGKEYTGQYSVKGKPFKLRLRRNLKGLYSIEILVIGKATKREFVACTFANIPNEREVEANWNAFVLNPNLFLPDYA